MIEFSVGMIRMCKGAPLSVLVALSLDREPHSASWLEAMVDYSDKSIAKALMFLQEMGYVTHNSRYAWQLADGMQQLPLGATQLEEPGQDDSEKFRVGEIPSPHDVVNINTESCKNTSSNNTGDSEKLRVEDNRTALAAIGVNEPTRSRLATLPAVNPRMIRYNAHISAAARSARNPTGLAISLIKRGSQAPEDWIDPGEEVPEPPPGEGEPEPLEALTPLSDAQLQAWDTAVAGLPIRPVDRATWLPREPAGVSAETGAVVLRLGNQVAAEWIRANALEDLQRVLGCPVRVEVCRG